VRALFLSLALLLPLLVIGQSTKPTAPLVPKGQKYTNTEHKVEWTLLDDKSWLLKKEPQTGVLAVIMHKDEQGGSHPSVMLSFDKLPKEVSTVKDYAEINISALSKYGFTDIKQSDTTFNGLAAIEVEAYTEGGKKVANQLYLIKNGAGYVITTTCPASMYERYQKQLKLARSTLAFTE
jgi:hypothetical protein